MRIPEYLYSFTENDFRSSGQKQFDYVNPRNRDLQVEMERVLTGHLKKNGAFLKPDFAEIDLFKEEFKTEASVIIPVKNRIKTIGDAVNSALSQKTDFRFNVIVVDNFSDDGTTELLRTLSAVNKNLVHLVPARGDLLIGGCWNLAVHNELCGRFAVQLDSDDIYKDQNTLQTIVDAFREEKCGMVIGAYILTDFSLNEIEPGLVDHREWTPDNGPNNALRINGLGAPRAFFTPLLRKLGVPNVSYGEDYYLGLRISREFKIGRIYKPVYLCRRWEENTDSSLDIVKLNNHNLYKDRLRTFEILSRKKMNSIK
jgi:glycosyltransferase involved in cell wall biosynthesis